MAGTFVEVTDKQALEAFQRGGRSSPDDVTITLDGRRLDTKEKVLAFLAEIGAVRSVPR